MNSSVQKTMKTFYWLVRREFWANKGLFLWTPLAIGGFLLFLYVSAEIWLDPFLKIDGYLDPVSHKAELTRWVNERIYASIMEMSHFFVHVLMISSAFLSSVYLFGALHGDRRDRSMYFWRSFPTSDAQEVGVKLFFPLFLAPLINLLIAVISFLVASFLIASYSLLGHVNVFVAVFSNMEIFKFAHGLLLLLPYYMLWSLPTVAWFLMISAGSKSRVFPWALGIPLATLFFAAFLKSILKLNWDFAWILNQVITRWIAANVPASWVANKEITRELFQGASPGSGYFTLERISNVEWGNPSLWIGVVAGLVMIMLTIRLRKNAAELNY